MNTNQKGSANIILVVVIVILLGAVGYFSFVKKSELIAQKPTPTTTPAPTTAPQNINRYINKYYNYSLELPDGWRLATEYMRAINATLPVKNFSDEKADYVIVTKASKEEENNFMKGWPHGNVFGYGLSPGETIFIRADYVALEGKQIRYQALVNSETIGNLTSKTYLKTITLENNTNSLFVTIEHADDDVLEFLHVSCESSQIVRGGTNKPLKSLATFMRLKKESERNVSPLLLKIANSLNCDTKQ